MDTINIDLLQIKSNEINEQYDLSIGNTYKDILSKRKRKQKVKDSHHQKTIGKDQIYYPICSNFDNQPNYAIAIPNAQVKKHNWKITSISWPHSTFCY